MPSWRRGFRFRATTTLRFGEAAQVIRARFMRSPLSRPPLRFAGFKRRMSWASMLTDLRYRAPAPATSLIEIRQSFIAADDLCRRCRFCHLRHAPRSNGLRLSPPTANGPTLPLLSMTMTMSWRQLPSAEFLMPEFSSTSPPRPPFMAYLRRRKRLASASAALPIWAKKTRRAGRPARLVAYA